MSDEKAIAQAPQPTIRMRIEHSRTIKEGWGYSSTVELTGSDIKAIEMQVLLETARRLGEQERDIRNARDEAMREKHQ